MIGIKGRRRLQQNVWRLRILALLVATLALWAIIGEVVRELVLWALR